MPARVAQTNRVRQKGPQPTAREEWLYMLPAGFIYGSEPSHTGYIIEYTTQRTTSPHGTIHQNKLETERSMRRHAGDEMHRKPSQRKPVCSLERAREYNVPWGGGGTNARTTAFQHATGRIMRVRVSVCAGVRVAARSRVWVRGEPNPPARM